LGEGSLDISKTPDAAIVKLFVFGIGSVAIAMGPVDMGEISVALGITSDTVPLC